MSERWLSAMNTVTLKSPKWMLVASIFYNSNSPTMLASEVTQAIVQRFPELLELPEQELEAFKVNISWILSQHPAFPAEGKVKRNGNGNIYRIDWSRLGPHIREDKRIAREKKKLEREQNIADLGAASPKKTRGQPKPKKGPARGQGPLTPSRTGRTSVRHSPYQSSNSSPASSFPPTPEPAESPALRDLQNLSDAFAASLDFSASGTIFNAESVFANDTALFAPFTEDLKSAEAAAAPPAPAPASTNQVPLDASFEMQNVPDANALLFCTYAHQFQVPLYTPQAGSLGFEINPLLIDTILGHAACASFWAGQIDAVQEFYPAFWPTIAFFQNQARIAAPDMTEVFAYVSAQAWQKLPEGLCVSPADLMLSAHQ